VACESFRVIEDFDRCYRAVRSRDTRFDGWFWTGVTSTGIYCRPSCPATTPKASNVRFFPTAAAAQSAGFRACRRCRPDATPGDPSWNQRADVVGRAMRLIADGVVDREGVAGLARRLGYSERHLHRQLVAEVGAGPLALARANRASTARILLETTDLPISEVVWASGFSSTRQFNDTIRAVYATTPSELRRHRDGVGAGVPGTIRLRLPTRAPFDGEALVEFLGARAVPGVEEVVGGTYRRTVSLPRGIGIVALTPFADQVDCELRLEDLRDLSAAVQRCRRLFDLDADAPAVVEQLGSDPILGPLVAAAPGRRIPGTVDGAELAVRAVLGQQVSVAGARTLAGELVAAIGQPLPSPDGGLTHLFPAPAAVAVADPSLLRMPTIRRLALLNMAAAIHRGQLCLDVGADRAEAVVALQQFPGIGPWTAAYVAMRALGDPDVFLESDLGVRRALEHLGQPGDPVSAAALAERWRPWRAYAVQHLWSVDTRSPRPLEVPA
jgi:AraC family transcriptional regulator, regulatory protein of adaptative response / DNA-3-methyladenine glycosylase II